MFFEVRFFVGYDLCLFRFRETDGQFAVSYKIENPFLSEYFKCYNLNRETLKVAFKEKDARKLKLCERCIIDKNGQIKTVKRILHTAGFLLTIGLVNGKIHVKYVSFSKPLKVGPNKQVRVTETPYTKETLFEQFIEIC